MTSNVITAVIITGLIIIIFRAIVQANRKIEEQIISKNHKMTKDYVKRLEFLLKRAVELNKVVRILLFVSIPLSLIVFFIIPVLGVIVLTMEVLVLTTFVLITMTKSSLEKKIARFRKINKG